MVIFLFKLIFRFNGWKVGNSIPSDIKRCIVIAAPHTSNWDFVYGIVAVNLLQIKVNYLAKKELFVWPIKRIFTKSGGIPVERKNAQNVVEAMIKLFKERKQLILAIPTEGTRKGVAKWKSGFYRIALAANVPVVLGYIDYKKKEVGFGPIIYLSGDKEKDAMKIREFYEGVQAKIPEYFNLDAIRFD